MKLINEMRIWLNFALFMLCMILLFVFQLMCWLLSWPILLVSENAFHRFTDWYTIDLE
jgi:hypothetical protein